MTNNKKIGNQTGAVSLPSSSVAAGSFVSSEAYRFIALSAWPKPVTGLVSSVGDYVLLASSGVAYASGSSFVPCQGQELLATSFSDLYDALGTTFGTGDGSNFNSPPVYGINGYLKATSAPSGALASGNLPSHTHEVQGWQKTSGFGGGPIAPGGFFDITASGFVGTTGGATNNGKHKEVIPMLTSVNTQALIGSVVQYLLPTTVSDVLSVVAEGVLIASGQAISRDAYPVLFERLGVDYGNGDGSTTFNIPDYRGVFLRAPSGVTEQPNTLLTGSGYAQDTFAAHTHNVFWPYPAGGTNNPNVTYNGIGSLISPATSASNIAGVESRPPNFTCLTCIVASGGS
jgi:microcystin-dependent protein